MSVDELVAVSRYYGSNPEFVVAGGGNTSFKTGDTLYIKGSGAALSDLTVQGLVKMDREKLARIWEKAYPQDPGEREAAVLADMMAARKPGEEQKRPSVETLLHDLLPFSLVIHLHPALVNGLTCSAEGEKAASDLFGNEAIWIPIVNPGYILSGVVKDAIETCRQVNGGKTPGIIFLQNHGVFVGADSTRDIHQIYTRIMDTLNAKITRKPDFSGETDTYGASRETAKILGELYDKAAGGPGQVRFRRNAEYAKLVKDRGSFYPLSSAFTPDHIVYAGSDPLFIENPQGSGENLEPVIQGAWQIHLDKTGRIPKIAALQNLGVFGIGSSEKNALLGLELFTDAVKVAVYSLSFGGPRFMTADKIDFINNWEVERYRSQVSGAAGKQ